MLVISLIFHFQDRIPINYIDMKNSFDSQLQIHSICSIRIDSSNRVFIEKPLTLEIKDQWILSYCQSLISSVRNEMETYHLNRVIPKLLKFIEQLTNWYVRFNRKRLKGETGPEDCVHALTTLYSGKTYTKSFYLDQMQKQNN